MNVVNEAEAIRKGPFAKTSEGEGFQELLDMQGTQDEL